MCKSRVQVPAGSVDSSARDGGSRADRPAAADTSITSRARERRKKQQAVPIVISVVAGVFLLICTVVLAWIIFGANGPSEPIVAQDNAQRRGPIVAQKEEERHSGTCMGYTESRLLAFSPDGETLASPGQSGTITIWDVQTGVERLTLKGHRSRVSSVAFSPDGKTLASGSEDLTIKLWDVRASAERLTLKGHTSGVLSMAFSPDGNTLASGSNDWTIKLWDVRTGMERTTLKGHGAAVSSLAFSPDAKTLASAADDKTIRFWDVKAGNEGITIQFKRGLPDFCQENVNSLAFSPDGKTLASAGLAEGFALREFEYGSIKLWDIKTGRETMAFQGGDLYFEQAGIPVRRDTFGRPHEEICCLSFSPNGQTLASASKSGYIRIWHVQTGREETILKLWDKETHRDHTTFKPHDGPLHSVAFSPDGKTLASLAEDLTLKFWHIEIRQPPTKLRGHQNSVVSVAFSPDGKTLASASWDTTVKLWDVDTGLERKTFRGHTGRVVWVAFSPDGKTLASASTDRTIRVWDVETGFERAALEGHTDYIGCVAFSPDGKTLASASRDGTIRIWDPRAAREETTFKKDLAFRSNFGDPSRLFVEFSANGQTLVSGGYGDSVGVWNLRTGQSTMRIGSSVYVAVSPDGRSLAVSASRRILAASAARHITVYDLKTGRKRTDFVGAGSRLVFSPDGNKLASLDSNRTCSAVLLWDITPGRLWTTLQAGSGQNGGTLTCLAFSPDRKTLAAGDSKHAIYLWRTPDQQPELEKDLPQARARKRGT